ncbi:hypothetical protein HAX54_024168 [Datura stramonium]|uniref:Uncharacterized protein n=1 Tax=Datura stramonium TaxID=4076 RepID=A0ABS8UYZ1_DATST|nr:hypothetical protein [Datura stramonium]
MTGRVDGVFEAHNRGMDVSMVRERVRIFPKPAKKAILIVCLGITLIGTIGDRDIGFDELEIGREHKASNVMGKVGLSVPKTARCGIFALATLTLVMFSQLTGMLVCFPN